MCTVQLLYREILVTMEIKVLMVQVANLERMVKMVLVASLVAVDHLVSLDLLDPLEPQALM